MKKKKASATIINNNVAEQKPKKSIKIIVNIFTIILFLSMSALIYSLYLISGIESELRYAGMIILFVINIVLTILLRKLVKKNKLSRYILFILVTSILIIIQAFGGYYILKTYSTLNGINKNELTYTTALVVKNDSKLESITDLKDLKVGIVEDETSIDSYIIGTEIIDEYNLSKKNTVVDFDDFTNLVKALYDGDIDVMIISESYPSMFKSIDKYKNIKDETKIIYTKEKTLTKDEIASITGDDIKNFNQSNSITKPFTVLVMGIDSTANTLKKNATGNGDALMLITFNPKTLNATILSIPRDTYVPIACFANQKENKITHAAWNGESCMIKTIENFTGINIDYYVKINFQGVVKLVNALNGIDVDVPIEFCESNSHRATSTNKLICLNEGEQTLNGEQALALARHRKTLLTGDLQRGINQQIVVQGILNKAKTLKNANQMMEVLDTISKNMDTNFTTNQLLSFYDIAKSLVLTSSESDNLINIQQLYLSGSGQMIYDEGIGMVLYNYIINKSSLEQIVKEMETNLSTKTTLKDKKMDFNIKEKYEMETIGSNNLSSTARYTLLPNFVGSSKSYAINWLTNKGVSYKIVEKTVSSGTNDQVLSQSLPESKRIDLISGTITLTVAKIEQEQEQVEVTPVEEPDDEQIEETPEEETPITEE